jgi:SAM-dependent methyltransferase
MQRFADGGGAVATVACTLLFVDLTGAIRDNYDSVAGEYARRIFDELQHKPLDRQLLARFAAETAGRGQVCDMGCGPGHVARALHEAGANVFGLDLSPSMLDEARRLNPGIDFQIGNMLALDLADDALAGITAFYAVVNLPPSTLPTAFGEMLRVLQPGGLLLLASHIGEEVRHVTTFLDRPIAMDFFYLPPAVMRGLPSRGNPGARSLPGHRIPNAPRLLFRPQALMGWVRMPAG